MMTSTVLTRDDRDDSERRPRSTGTAGGPRPASHAQRFDIQGLRALAVVLVILDHTVHFPNGGFIGVDVFFVISGFLITGLLAREIESTGNISFRMFYVRRFRRIIPASVLVLVSTVVAARLLLPTTRADSATVDGVWALLFAGNWRMASSGTDYFQEGLPPSPLQHYWSLAVEEQFYFVWPLIMIGVIVLARQYKKVGLAGSSRLWLIMAIVVLSAASFAWSVLETAQSPTVAYFSTFTRAWELGVGALLALALHHLPALPTVARIAAGWVGLSVIVASAFLITSDMPFPGALALVPVLGAALVLAAGHGATTSSYRSAMFPLTNPVSRYLGDISYSLYLWHFPVVVLLLAVLPEGPIHVAAALASTLVLSVLSYHFVETPIRRSRWLEKRPYNQLSARGRKIRSFTEEHRRTLIGGVAVVIAAAVLVGGVAYTEARTRAVYADALAAAAAEEAVTAEVAPEPEIAAAPACLGAGFLLPANQPCDYSTLGELTPSIDTAASDRDDLTADCFRPEGGKPVSCSLGSTDPSALRVAVVGDSHAGMYIPALATISLEHNWALTTFTGFGCQWIPMSTTDCGEQAQLAQKTFTEGDPFDAIVVTATRKISGNWADKRADAMKEWWQPVLDRGTRILVIEDAPTTTEDTLLCIQRLGFDPASNDCATPIDTAYAQNDSLQRIATELGDGVTVIATKDLLCTATECPMVVGNVVVYRDTASHITASYVRTMTPTLEERLLAALPVPAG